MSRQRHIEVLLAKAGQDDVALRALLDHPDVAVEVFGFHAQQAAEKLLKAAIKACGADYPLTHRLTDLLDLLADLGVPVPAEFDALKELTPFAVEFRYDVLPPAVQDDLDRPVCLRRLERLRRWVEETVSARIQTERQ